MREEEIKKIKELTESQKTLIIKKIIMTSGTAKKTPTYEQIFEKVKDRVILVFYKTQEEGIAREDEEQKGEAIKITFDGQLDQGLIFFD